MERFHRFVTLMQPKLYHLRFPRKFSSGGFLGVLSPNSTSVVTLVFDRTPPSLLKPGYYMERFHGFVTLMQPKINRLR